MRRSRVASSGSDASATAIEPPLSKADQDRITRLLVVLTASASLRMWRDHLGSSVDEVVDDIDWFLKAAIAATRKEKAR